MPPVAPEGGSDYLGRWIDLAAHLLTQPYWHDPMLEICDELSVRFCAAGAGTVDVGPDRLRLGLYRSSGVDPEEYAPQIVDHPLAQHYRATDDPRACSLSDAHAFLADPRACALLDRLRAENLRDFVFLPLRPRHRMRHRWLGFSSGDRFGACVRDELERLGPLLRAIDAQASVLARSFSALERSCPLQETPLSGRELAVLALMARGLTAIAIGTRLQISPRTVSKHQQNIYRKLEVGDRLSAVLRAHAIGILPYGTTERGAEVRVIELAVDQPLGAPSPA